MAVKIGFVGTGNIANHHMRTIAQIDRAHMSAFCDVVAEKAQAAASAYGGTAYTDFREMYDREQLDAVYICLPPFAHKDQELEAINRGLPIFVEKPVAVALEKAGEILEAIQSRGLLSAVGYHWRYMDIVERARERIGDQPIGFALGSWTGGMPGVPWWRVLEQSGGQMVEQTTHIFDLARHFLGAIKTVHACARTGLLEDVENYNVHDASLTNLRFESGAIASITSACMLETGGYVGLDLYLKDQVLRLTGTSLTVEKAGDREVLERKNDPTLAEDTAFVQAVESGDRSLIRSDYADALKTLELTLAATRSAIEGCIVEL